MDTSTIRACKSCRDAVHPTDAGYDKRLCDACADAIKLAEKLLRHAAVSGSPVGESDTPKRKASTKPRACKDCGDIVFSEDEGYGMRLCDACLQVRRNKQTYTKPKRKRLNRKPGPRADKGKKRKPYMQDKWRGKSILQHEASERQSEKLERMLDICDNKEGSNQRRDALRRNRLPKGLRCPCCKRGPLLQSRSWVVIRIPPSTRLGRIFESYYALCRKCWFNASIQKQIIKHYQLKRRVSVPDAYGTAAPRTRADRARDARAKLLPHNLQCPSCQRTIPQGTQWRYHSEFAAQWGEVCICRKCHMRLAARKREMQYDTP